LCGKKKLHAREFCGKEKVWLRANLNSLLGCSSEGLLLIQVKNSGHHVCALEREQRNLPKKVKALQFTQQNVGKHMKK
jgi:hypothetical protein